MTRKKGIVSLKKILSVQGQWTNRNIPFNAAQTATCLAYKDVQLFMFFITLGHPLTSQFHSTWGHRCPRLIYLSMWSLSVRRLETNKNVNTRAYKKERQRIRNKTQQQTQQKLQLQRIVFIYQRGDVFFPQTVTLGTTRPRSFPTPGCASFFFFSSKCVNMFSFSRNSQQAFPKCCFRSFLVSFCFFFLFLFLSFLKLLVQFATCIKPEFRPGATRSISSHASYGGRSYQSVKKDRTRFPHATDYMKTNEIKLYSPKDKTISYTQRWRKHMLWFGFPGNSASLLRGYAKAGSALTNYFPHPLLEGKSPFPQSKINSCPLS